jgi:biotin carboxylase
MKQRLQQAGVRVPRYLPFDPAAFSAAPDRYVAAVGAELGWPVVAKPARGANNRQVELLARPAELHDWCRNHPDGDAFQIEEHIQGVLYHCNAITHAGETPVLQVGEYLWPCLEFGSGRPIGSVTLAESGELFQRIRRFNARVLGVLQPPQPCVTHLEVFRTPEEELVFLEVAARAPGALVSEMCERRTGVHLLEANLRLQMGSAPEPASPTGPHCGWAWFPSRRGTVVALQAPSLPCASELRWHAKPGMRYMSDSPSPVLEVLFWHADRRQVRHAAAVLRQCQPVTYGE